jgi:hypothetical protein
MKGFIVFDLDFNLDGDLDYVVFFFLSDNLTVNALARLSEEITSYSG